MDNSKRDVISIAGSLESRQEKQNSAMMDQIKDLKDAIRNTAMDIDDTLEQIDDRYLVCLLILLNVL